MAELMEFTIRGTMDGQMYINRFNFVAPTFGTTISTSFALAQAMGFDPTDTSAPKPNSVIDNILIASPTFLQINELQARNIYVTTDFYTVGVSGVGWQGAATAGNGFDQDTISMKLRTNLINTAIGRGRVSLAPPSSDATTQSGILNAGYLNSLTDIVTALNLPPTGPAPDSLVFNPSVVSREEYTVPGTGEPPLPPTRKARRYYADKTTQLTNTAQGVTWEVVPRAGTAGSRKFGKGR